MGGLGFRCAQRLAPVVYWASWADALPMLQQRLPTLARKVVECLFVEEAMGCLGDLQPASRMLDRSSRPSELGGTPTRDPTATHHSSRAWQVETWWQYFSSPSSECHFRETVVLAQPCAADHVPVWCFAYVARVHREATPTMVFERLRLPLITDNKCECRGVLDDRGQHRAACHRSGRLRSRAVPTERTLARVCWEAGATVRCNAKIAGYERQGARN